MSEQCKMYHSLMKIEHRAYLLQKNLNLATKLATDQDVDRPGYMLSDRFREGSMTDNTAKAWRGYLRLT